jgi:3-keto-L-gulonate-6-phosphate decarboxylase
MSILTNETDIIIVGRGIITSDDPVASAIKYKEASYNAYLKRCQQI